MITELYLYSFNPLYPRLFQEKNNKMGPIIIIYYHINSIDEKFNWTHKDCHQMMAVGYNGLKKWEKNWVRYRILFSTC